MKSYKTINSKAIRDKIERLCNVTLSNSKDIDDMIFIFVHIDRYCNYTNGRETFINSKFEEITQSDFLALPEPFKVGDWVKFYNNVFTHVFEINEIIQNCARSWHEQQLYVLSKCTKLTPEQIKILGLED